MDDSEISRLYEQYGYFVHQRCLLLLRQSADADDVCQEVFLRAQKYPRKDLSGSALAWLYTIAVRCCFDFTKKRRREELRTDDSLNEVAPVQAIDPDRRAWLGAVLRRMDARTCEIGILHYLDGYSMEEVASQTGYSRRTVYTRLRAFGDHLRQYGF